jgi:hypothetical protein
MLGSGKTLSCKTHYIVITEQNVESIAIEGEWTQKFVKRASVQFLTFSDIFKVF